MQHIRVTKTFLRAVDGDIVVLALSLFENVMLAELWIGFGSGKNYRDITVHIRKVRKCVPSNYQSMSF